MSQHAGASRRRASTSSSPSHGTRTCPRSLRRASGSVCGARATRGSARTRRTPRLRWRQALLTARRRRRRQRCWTACSASLPRPSRRLALRAWRQTGRHATHRPTARTPSSTRPITPRSSAARRGTWRRSRTIAWWRSPSPCRRRWTRRTVWRLPTGFARHASTARVATCSLMRWATARRAPFRLCATTGWWVRTVSRSAQTWRARSH
mmetsp:Transcript_56936/g.169236  ORF Transcript_56936/g.169236 Transcript_56936/m.169236 type:complete len:208 (-) Transcript_56936:790-1413(-)